MDIVHKFYEIFVNVHVGMITLSFFVFITFTTDSKIFIFIDNSFSCEIIVGIIFLIIDTTVLYNFNWFWIWQILLIFPCPFYRSIEKWIWIHHTISMSHIDFRIIINFIFICFSNIIIPLGLKYCGYSSLDNC